MKNQRVRLQQLSKLSDTKRLNNEHEKSTIKIKALFKLNLSQKSKEIALQPKRLNPTFNKKEFNSPA